MRIWHPIPCSELDRQRLLGEHRELHCIYTVLTQGKKGYSRHPETLRWRGHLPALVARHNEQVEEMQARGWNHHSPLTAPRGSVEWPGTWEPLETMQAKLREKVGKG